MGVMKAGVPNGGVSGDSNYFTPNQAFPNGKSGGKQFWSSGWNQTEETLSPGGKEKGGTNSAKKGASGGGRKHACVGCM